jgi:hypothetical protein
MPFLNNLSILAIRGTNYYTLLSPLVYEHNGKVYTAPAGFKTDFASIPKLLHGIIDESEADIRDAAVIHDFLYTEKSIPRKEADKVLYIAMRELGASMIKAGIVYNFVRLFGGSHYG